MIHSVTVQYLYRSGIGENDTLGKTSAIADVCERGSIVCRVYESLWNTNLTQIQLLKSLPTRET
jgi:hypothetical protein